MIIFLKIVFEVFILYQITQTITESKISKPFREYLRKRGESYMAFEFLYNLLSCFLCTSVWIGFILTPFLFNLAEYLGYNYISWFWNGLFFSCIAWFLRVWEASKQTD